MPADAATERAGESAPKPRWRPSALTCHVAMFGAVQVVMLTATGRWDGAYARATASITRARALLGLGAGLRDREPLAAADEDDSLAAVAAITVVLLAIWALQDRIRALIPADGIRLATTPRSTGASNTRARGPPVQAAAPATAPPPPAVPRTPRKPSLARYAAYFCAVQAIMFTATGTWGNARARATAWAARLSALLPELAAWASSAGLTAVRDAIPHREQLTDDAVDSAKAVATIGVILGTLWALKTWVRELIPEDGIRLAAPPPEKRRAPAGAGGGGTDAEPASG